MRCLTVIVHHRGPEMLAACLRSLLAEMQRDDRAVLFCNGLDEELPEIAIDDQILIARSDANLGFAEANNRGVQAGVEAFGAFEALLFLNNDAFVQPTALNHLRSALEHHPNCAIVGPRLMIEHAPDHINSLGLNVTKHGEAWDDGIGRHTVDYGALPTDGERLAVTGAALMMRSSSFEELGGWNTIYGYYFEDIDLCIRAWRRGQTVRWIRDAVVLHRISASSAPVPEFKILHSWRNQLVLVLLHWPVGFLIRHFPVLMAKQVALYWRRRRAGAHHDARLQARAISQALRRIPSVGRQRLRHGPQRTWTRFLKRPGSVPEIQLPSAEAAA